MKLKKKLFHIINNSPELRRRGLCFLGSVLIHVIFICLCLTSVIPIRIYIYEERIIDVVIAPPEKLFFPVIEKEQTGINDLADNFPVKNLKRNFKFPEEEKEFENEGFKETIKVKADDISSYPHLSSRFSLNLPSSRELDLSLGNKLALSLYSEKKEKLLKEIDKNYEQKDLNVLKYFYSDFSNIRLSKSSVSSGDYGTQTIPRRLSTSFNKRDYDLTPWAKKIVDKIQKNWLIPPGEKTRAKGQVGISVIVKKGGELLSIKIIESSEIQWFDQAALKALNLSSPFPSLPEDFPDKTLETYFVFKYND